MKDSELYEKLLGLKEPWFVEKVSLDLSAACVTVLIGHSQGATFPCPVCGQFDPSTITRSGAGGIWIPVVLR